MVQFYFRYASSVHASASPGLLSTVYRLNFVGNLACSLQGAWSGSTTCHVNLYHLVLQLLILTRRNYADLMPFVSHMPPVCHTFARIFFLSTKKVRNRNENNNILDRKWHLGIRSWKVCECLNILCTCLALVWEVVEGFWSSMAHMPQPSSLRAVGVAVVMFCIHTDVNLDRHAH